uniref:Metalloendopeptidase n=1 Tax=Parastrongyloides trichosuri TaxID=131310 RepID=A0A0N4Z2X5_PARTI
MLIFWKFPIEYMIGPGVNETTVRKALEILENETCIPFREVTYFRGPGLYYFNGSGCESFIGMVSDIYPQEISLGPGCDSIVVALHETSHALGMIHEMNRPDRDKYVFINTTNLSPFSAYNFVMNPANKSISYNLTYDMGSAMHYDRFSGTRNGHLVTIPKRRNYLYTIGQTTEMGFNDIKQLNLFYCKTRCYRTLPCKVGGYPNPRNCSECKCPRFYTGQYCERLLPSDSTCGEKKLMAQSEYKTISLEGIKSCYIQIVAPKGHRIKMIVKEAVLKQSFVCQPNSGLEIKRLVDKSVSGIMFCRNVTNIKVYSQKCVVAMRYVGEADSHKVKILYKAIKL